MISAIGNINKTRLAFYQRHLRSTINSKTDPLTDNLCFKIFHKAHLSIGSKRGKKTAAKSKKKCAMAFAQLIFFFFISSLTPATTVFLLFLRSSCHFSPLLLPPLSRRYLNGYVIIFLTAALLFVLN